VSGFRLADDFFHTTTHVRLNFARDFFVGATPREAVVSYSGSPPADSQLSNAYRCSFVRPKWTEATPTRDAAILAYLEQLQRRNLSAGPAILRHQNHFCFVILRQRSRSRATPNEGSLHSGRRSSVRQYAGNEMNFKCRRGRPRPCSTISEAWTGQRTSRTEDQPSSPTDCHPDRSFSYPKGMRSGVEGPPLSYTDSNGSGNKNRRRLLDLILSLAII
jgi:hypothetical protein